MADEVQKGIFGKKSANGNVGGFKKEAIALTRKLRHDKTRFKTSDALNVKSSQTGIVKRNSESRKLFIGHLYSEEEAIAAEYIWEHPENLRFIEKSELGAVKDMTSQKAQKNIAKKLQRRVTHYNLYEFEYEGVTWRVKLESFQNGTEQFYSIVK